jgi:hypothetical protein
VGVRKSTNTPPISSFLFSPAAKQKGGAAYTKGEGGQTENAVFVSDGFVRCPKLDERPISSECSPQNVQNRRIRTASSMLASCRSRDLSEVLTRVPDELCTRSSWSSSVDRGGNAEGVEAESSDDNGDDDVKSFL